MSALDKLLARVQARCHDDGEGWTDDGCWIWTGATGGNGKPQIIIDGKVTYVRRALLVEIAQGPMPKRWVAARTCESSQCCNPAHAKATSKAKAVKFAVARGAYRDPMKLRKMAATKRRKSRYSDELVQAIRTNAEGLALAKAAGMCQSHAKAIRQGINRRALADPFAGLMP